jgi:hypothetical protein
VRKVVGDVRTDKGLVAFLLILVLVLIIAISCANSARADSSRHVMLVQASGGLRVRDTPHLNGKQVYLLDDCETVVVYGWRNGWALVGKNIPPHARLGWVCADYLK